MVAEANVGLVRSDRHGGRRLELRAALRGSRRKRRGQHQRSAHGRTILKTIAPAAGDDGAFTLRGLPFGSYYAAALARLPPEGADAWQDPAYLESLVARGGSVTIGEGHKVSLNLRVATR
jgi:hypothetical protein